MANQIPDFVAGERDPETIERAIQVLIRSALGQPGNGVPWSLTQYSGTDWANVLSSVDGINGRAARIVSENTTYELNVSNSGMNIIGAPTLDAFTQGSVLFVGASKVLSEDNTNLFWDDGADTLKAKNVVVTTKAAVGAAALGTEVFKVTGNAQVTTFLGVGAAPDTTHALLVTGLAEVTSRMGVGGAAHASETLRVTGTMSSSDKAAVKGLTGTEDFVVNGTQQVTTRLGVGAAPDGTAAFKVTGAAIITTDLTVDTSTLFVDSTNNRVGILTATPIATCDIAGVTRITGTSSPASGAGLELHYSSGTCLLFCFDRSGSTYKPLDEYASTWRIMISGNETVKADGTGIGFYAHATAAQGTVTGSRGGNAALASLLTKLAATGIIVDSSSA